MFHDASAYATMPDATSAYGFDCRFVTAGRLPNVSALRLVSRRHRRRLYATYHWPAIIVERSRAAA